MSRLNALMRPSRFGGAAALLLLFSYVAAVSAVWNLEFVTLVYRHGDRTPIVYMPKDLPENAESTWSPPGSGLLTVEGMRQHYALGKAFRERYITQAKFLSPNYDRREIYIHSTDVDRTLMSAESNLAGFFPPQGGEVIDPELQHWRPIPVHTVAGDSEILLRPYSTCPKYRDLLEDFQKSKEWKSKTAQNEAFFKTLSDLTGLNVDLNSIWAVRDTVVCELAHNRKVLPGLEQHLPKMDELVDWYLEQTYLYGPRARLSGGFFVQTLRDLISRNTDPNQNNRKKMVVYSAHDTTVVLILSALRLFDKKSPDYAAQIRFEVGRGDDNVLAIKIFYQDNIMTLPGCTEACPIDKFMEITEEVLPPSSNFEEACGLVSTDESNQEGTQIGAVVLATLVIVLLVVAFSAAGYWYWKQQRREYELGHTRLVLDNALSMDV